jgi:pSer/pThr/pTyr-binding forkhead associated (FHA) protein
VPAPAPARISGGLVREPVKEEEAEILASLPSVDRRPTARMPLPSKVMRIGRTPDNDLVVSDLGVSRKHAELRKSPTGRYEIIDLGSHNGTFVNGSRITRERLAETDLVSFAGQLLRFAGGALQMYVDEDETSFEAAGLVVRSDAGAVLLDEVSFSLERC